MKANMCSIFGSSVLFLFLSKIAYAQENVCFILYQMADNDLEYFLREDNYELIQSPAIRKPSLTTWVYFDGRNIEEGFLNDLFVNIREPLKEVYFRDGSPLTESFKGSSYMTWDHETSRMVVDQELEGERDGDDPDTIQEFVTHALTDCVDNRGSTEFMVIFSSHGGGWGGFGGDENTVRRKLAAPNSRVVDALSASLADVPGAPEKFNVIGFDACLMSAVGALDEYHEITDYFLASEATVPGHGWAYDYFDNVDSALEIARDLHNDFLEQKQGNDVHLTPKTSALIDTSLFLDFLNAWDAFSAELARLLQADDPFILTQLARSRQIAIAFVGYSDEGKQATAVDVGSFLATFDAVCQPEETNELYALRVAAVKAYYDMQVESGVSPGTREATGVQIFWPTRSDFDTYTAFYTDALFENPSFATLDAPNWLEFLREYYAAQTPRITGTSVCSGNPTSLTEPTREGQLLLTPSSKEVGSGISVQSEVTRSTDEVIVDFGLDLTPGLARREAGGRRLTPGTAYHAHHPLLSGFIKRRQKRRRLQLEEDYLILFGGDVEGTYDGPEYKATWDGNFFIFFDQLGQLEPAFAVDLGGNSRALPVMYFPPSVEVSGADFPHRTTEDDAKAIGGIYGYLSSVVTSADEGVLTGSSLFTQSGETFSETPRSAGGQIVPIIYAEASIDGNEYSVYVGGFNGTVFDWSEDNEVGVRTQNWKSVLDKYQESRGLETVIVSMSAFDLDQLDNETLDGIDVAVFLYPEEESSASCFSGTWFVVLAAVSSAWFYLV